MQNTEPFLTKLIQSRDPVFVGSFFVSACLHATLILGWNNSFLKWEALHSKFVPYPAIFYTGTAESEKAATSNILSKGTHSSASLLSMSVHLPERIILNKATDYGFNALSSITPRSINGDAAEYSKPRTDVLQNNKKGIFQRVEHAEEQQKPVKIPKRVSRQARVEDIDLSDTRVFQVFSSYYSNLSAHIKLQSKYPPEVVRESKEGLVCISFVLHRNGQISTLTVAESSGDVRLDRAALKSIRDSVPFPVFPSEIKEDKMTLYLPVSFEVD